LKVAHISDSHLGYNQYRLVQRREDFFTAFKRAVDEAIERGVELIIHTGDLFESYHPDMATLSQAIKLFTEIKNRGVKVVAIAGNHDRVLRRGLLSPQKVLSDLELIDFIDPAGSTYYKDLFIAGFRYFPKSFIPAVRERFFDGFSREAERAGVSIFMFHQALDQYLPYEMAYEITVSELPENFSYYAGGHIHTYHVANIKNGIFSYPGATEFHSKVEARAGRRGFNIFDTETGKLERVELEGLRPFFVLKTNEERADGDLRELLEKVKECSQPPVVLIDYSYSKTEITAFSCVLKEIENRSLYLRVYELRQIEGKDPLLTEQTKSYAEIFEEYAKEQKLPKKAVLLGSEVVKGSVEDVSHLVEEFLKGELGDFFEEFKKFAEEFS